MSLAKSFLKIYNFVQARKDVVVQEVLEPNSTEISQCIDDILSIIDGPEFEVLIPNTANDAIVNVLKFYKEAFVTYPRLPYEAFIFTPNYEIAITKHRHPSWFPDTKVHYLLQRIENGHEYPHGYSSWCGSLTKRFNFPAFQIALYKERLAKYLPK